MGLLVLLVGMRDDDFKFISCAADPPQFFNLVSDHDDMQNLVDDQAFASQMGRLNGLASTKWDLKDLILKSKGSRPCFILFMQPCVRRIIIHEIISCFNWRLNALCVRM